MPNETPSKTTAPTPCAASTTTAPSATTAASPSTTTVPSTTTAPAGGSAASCGAVPYFGPAPGWETVQTGASATAANIALGPNTRSGDAPWDTVERLEEGDVLLYAMFWPAGRADLPPRELPLSLDDAQPGGLEGQPDDVYADRLGAQVDGWNIDLLVFYGGGDSTGMPPVPSRPSAEHRAAAQEQLARPAVPPLVLTGRRLNPDMGAADELTVVFRLGGHEAPGRAVHAGVPFVPVAPRRADLAGPGEPAESFISVAATHWEMVVTAV